MLHGTHPLIGSRQEFKRRGESNGEKGKKGVDKVDKAVAEKRNARLGG